MISWRSLISTKSDNLISDTYTQYTQNTQNTLTEDNFADIADIAYKENNLIYGLTITEIKQKAGADWDELKHNPEMLKAYALAISDIKTREEGKIPATYTTTTTCQSCGEVPIHPSMRCNGYVLGCPWCFNRAKGLPIPKPVQIRRKTENE